MIEENIVIGKGTSYPLEGILSLPDGKDKQFPAVVLVHGSGAHDRDETIGAVAPFKDIAEYLVNEGIAVFRYDKRTKIYGKQMMEDPSNITVESVSIEDAILATNLLKSDLRIDNSKVFIIGHSQGAMLSPRIDAEGGDFAGMVFLGGSPRTLWQIIYDQNQAGLASLRGDQKIQAQKMFDEFEALMNSIPTMSDDVARKTMAAGLSAYYYKEMDAHPVSDYLKNCAKPLLIMQGGKDISVSVEHDFNGYKKLLDGKSNVTFKFYPTLNHLFMFTTTGTINDYNIAGNVDKTALEDIASWILSK